MVPVLVHYSNLNILVVQVIGDLTKNWRQNISCIISKYNWIASITIAITGSTDQLTNHGKYQSKWFLTRYVNGIIRVNCYITFENVGIGNCHIHKILPNGEVIVNWSAWCDWCLTNLSTSCITSNKFCHEQLKSLCHYATIPINTFKWWCIHTMLDISHTFDTSQRVIFACK
jgi:hypothetical protein